MKFVAFIRGINVGGKTIVKMERLRDLLSAAGLESVRTYIQSGNIAFESESLDEDSARQVIEDVMSREFFQTPVMVRSRDELARLIAENPFAGDEYEEKQLHLVFLNNPLPDEKAELLLAQQSPNERFEIRGRDIYCLLLAGVADSALGKKFIENKLKTASTARNWRTMNAVINL